MFVELNVAESLQQLHVLHYSFSLQGIITFQQSLLPNVDSTCPTVLKRTADTEGLQNKTPLMLKFCCFTVKLLLGETSSYREEFLIFSPPCLYQ